MNRRSGLTIIEVLIALAIIGALFAVLAVTQVSTFKITRQSQTASSAMQVAASELDDLSRKVLADYADYAQCPTATVTCSGSVQTSGATGTFAITKDATTFSGGSSPGTDVLDISVSITKPAPVSLATKVSCIDESTPSSGSMPTVSNPNPCYPN